MSKGIVIVVEDKEAEIGAAKEALANKEYECLVCTCFREFKIYFEDLMERGIPVVGIITDLHFPYLSIDLLDDGCKVGGQLLSNGVSQGFQKDVDILRPKLGRSQGIDIILPQPFGLAVAFAAMRHKIPTIICTDEDGHGSAQWITSFLRDELQKYFIESMGKYPAISLFGGPKERGLTKDWAYALELLEADIEKISEKGGLWKDEKMGVCGLP